MRWAGWTDTLAGIKQYELTVYKMKLYGDKLAHHGVPELLRETLRNTENETNITLVDPGKASRFDVSAQRKRACMLFMKHAYNVKTNVLLFNHSYCQRN